MPDDGRGCYAERFIGLARVGLEVARLGVDLGGVKEECKTYQYKMYTTYQPSRESRVAFEKHGSHRAYTSCK